MAHARLTVSIDPGQKAALARLAARSGFSESSLARLALARLLTEPAIFLPAPHSTTPHNYERALEQLEAEREAQVPA